MQSDESPSVDTTKNMINVISLLSSLVNFCATIASAMWVRVDQAGFRAINYSLFFLLSSFVFHVNQVYDYYIQKRNQKTQSMNADVWGAIRDCALALVLLPLGTWSALFPSVPVSVLSTHDVGPGWRGAGRQRCTVWRSCRPSSPACTTASRGTRSPRRVFSSACGFSSARAAITRLFSSSPARCLP